MTKPTNKMRHVFVTMTTIIPIAVWDLF